MNNKYFWKVYIPVSSPVSHWQLNLPCLLSLQQLLGGGVELLVGQVGSLSQLLGLGLHKLFITVPGTGDDD